MSQSAQWINGTNAEATSERPIRRLSTLEFLLRYPVFLLAFGPPILRQRSTFAGVDTSQSHFDFWSIIQVGWLFAIALRAVYRLGSWLGLCDRPSCDHSAIFRSPNASYQAGSIHTEVRSLSWTRLHRVGGILAGCCRLGGVQHFVFRHLDMFCGVSQRRLPESSGLVAMLVCNQANSCRIVGFGSDMFRSSAFVGPGGYGGSGHPVQWRRDSSSGRDWSNHCNHLCL